MQKEIENTLAQYQDPYLEKDLFAAKAIKRLTIENQQIELDIVLGYPFEGFKKTLLATLTSLLTPVIEGRALKMNIALQVEAHTTRVGAKPLLSVKNIIAVGSGKGGVGKSTVALNLAAALAKDGAQVGLLDADIYGPSQPTMLGTSGQKPIIRDRTIQPIDRHGLQTMSIGYLVDPSAAMVWRGPMLGKALEQLMYDTQWRNLDYLIVDLPPGTGDVQLTLCQKMPVSGAVIVTTPQDLALHDVRRACEMFTKLNVPILGVVENMSMFHCPQCGHDEPIFSTGGGEKIAQEFAIKLLGQVPLNKHIREMSDAGVPPVLQEANPHYSAVFSDIARRTAAQLSLQAKDYSAKFPKIVVEQSGPQTKRP